MTEDKNSICCSWHESCTYYMQCEHLYNENKDLSEDVARLKQENKQMKSALEEIRTYLNTLSSIDSDFTNTETYLRIQDKINECIGG